ncbi:hypothetical protein CCH79_00009387 [Gambusia affinis]|uniref:Uncharacterized protein n=1 Tax=Gambusia affinis TaxID=33528 RepID=A0A315VCY3_GAMAF|nr:hypothetical protein CCH79_00009387 [Gambusia affinis]
METCFLSSLSGVFPPEPGGVFLKKLSGPTVLDFELVASALLRVLCHCRAHCLFLVPYRLWLAAVQHSWADRREGENINLGLP